VLDDADLGEMFGIEIAAAVKPRARASRTGRVVAKVAKQGGPRTREVSPPAAKNLPGVRRAPARSAKQKRLGKLR